MFDIMAMWPHRVKYCHLCFYVLEDTVDSWCHVFKEYYKNKAEGVYGLLFPFTESYSLFLNFLNTHSSFYITSCVSAFKLFPKIDGFYSNYIRGHTIVLIITFSNDLWNVCEMNRNIISFVTRVKNLSVLFSFNLSM